MADSAPPHAWPGERFQVLFAEPGAEKVVGLDATTTPAAAQRRRQVEELLAAAGILHRLQLDQGEDAFGNEVTYEELTLDVGFYTNICFWAQSVHWSVEAWRDEVSVETFNAVCRTVHAAVRRVTGWETPAGVPQYVRG